MDETFEHVAACWAGNTLVLAQRQISAIKYVSMGGFFLAGVSGESKIYGWEMERKCEQFLHKTQIYFAIELC